MHVVSCLQVRMTFALEVLPGNHLVGGHRPEALSVFLPTARKDPEPLPSPCYR